MDLRDQLDAGAAGLLAAFDDAGVRALLLKGPILRRLLYEAGEQRMYNDVDILVDPAALERARQTLRERGFLCMQDGLGVEDGRDALHAEEWAAGALPVDLHWRLPNADAPVGAAWQALYGPRQVVEIEGYPAATLSRAGLALHIAIHAAQHGQQHNAGIRDLELALARWPPELWNDAAVLATEIGAGFAFAAGLQMSPAGTELARRLGLAEVSELDWIPPDAWPRGTSHLRAFADAGSLVARTAVVRRALVPPVRWIVWQYPWARRRRSLQVVAYAMHLARAPLWAVRALRFQRRSASRPD